MRDLDGTWQHPVDCLNVARPCSVCCYDRTTTSVGRYSVMMQLMSEEESCVVTWSGSTATASVDVTAKILGSVCARRAMSQC
ncbi:hypothetical protein KC334_g36 [Hortaea werneckii]|nr:hypothetical protein KC334_g36 [Hortaea werneckii]KAI7028408.1 hypothetical protein KC355_g39 [Hortaea werneckii]